MKTKKKTFHGKQPPEVILLKKIGVHFRNTRFDKKMSLQDVAEKSGITYLTISKLEKGDLQNLSLATMTAIAGALDLTVSIDAI
jgi:transcriptional regulator with XRE-family HTH domain